MLMLSFALMQIAFAKPIPAHEKISGAVTLQAVPWGLVAHGGSTLRQRATGARRWETLYSVPHDNLYRIASHPTGGLLAVWEKDPKFHLFTRNKQHRAFVRPTIPGGSLPIVEQIHFSENGRAAIVLTTKLTGRPPQTYAIYRYDLSKPAAAPVLLAQEKGRLIWSWPRAAVFAIPKNLNAHCFMGAGGCYPMTEIKAWEWRDTDAVAKTLLKREGDVMSLAYAIAGSDENQMALLVEEERPRNRGILRWRYGSSPAEYRLLPKGLALQSSQSRLLHDGSLVEIWQPSGDFGLTIQRHPTNGETKTMRLPPLPRRQGLKDTSGVHYVNERANGDLFVHWGDYLMLIGKKGEARRMNLEPVPGKYEWAGADVYVPQPEALWIGIERRGTRDFYLMAFAEIEAKATRESLN